MNDFIDVIRRNTILLVPLLVTVLLAGCGKTSIPENTSGVDTSSVQKIAPSSFNMVEKDFEGVTFSVPDVWHERSENGLTAYLNDTESAGIGFTTLNYSDDMTWEEAAEQIKEYMVADPDHEVLEDGVYEIDSVPAFYMRTFDNSTYATIYYVNHLDQHIFLQIILTSNNSDSEYSEVYEYILNSIKFPKNDAAKAEESKEFPAEPTPTEEPNSDPNDLPDDNPLKGIADPEEMRDVFDEIDDLMNDAYLNGPLATETDMDKIKTMEDELIQQVADKHGLTYDNVRDIYLTIDGLYNYDTSKIRMLFGETVEATINGTTLIVKAKIKPGIDNESTINQNYLNVGNIIRSQDGSYFHEIQYWAVTDMSDGSEDKVIMFTVPKDVIKKVNNLVITDEQLADYVEDLWIHPSLL